MSNVVNLPKRKGKTATTSKTVAKSAETRLINQCVVFAQSLAAWNAGFDADPHGNNVHAEKLGREHLLKRVLALQAINKISATTPEALQAKARIAPLVIDDAIGNLNEEEEEFFRSFAADVKAFLKPIITQRWRDERQAKGLPVQDAAAS